MPVSEITASDLNGKGVVGQPDTPGLSALDMQNKVEEIPRAVIIPRLNILIKSHNTVENEAQQAIGTANRAQAIAEGSDIKAQQAISTAQAAQLLAQQSTSTANSAKSIAEGIDNKAQQALNTAVRADRNAAHALDLALQVGDLIDPTTGTINPLQVLINNLYYALSGGNEATFGDWDAADWTCALFDSKDFTWQVFDLSNVFI